MFFKAVKYGNYEAVKDILAINRFFLHDFDHLE